MEREVHMEINIEGRQLPVTPQLRQQVERKVRRLARLVGDNARVEVIVGEEQTRSSKDRYTVQISLPGSSHAIRSKVSALNTSAALDLVLDKIEAQLGKQKGRQTAKRHKGAPMKRLALSRSGQLSAIEAGNEREETSVGEQENEQIWSRIKEIRRLPTRPMNDQEVIAEMERTGATYFPFYNQETDSVNVMYRLDDEGYGLLVPALEEV
uniref:Ribosomal subunit interface protein n=1 Tax=Thermosporothrix sp. COM3 TaxID=2490863 RepID=A0A455SRJ7_9CHLR|nr:ribosomal subunit interface protein [Thermosporothrix sp. COM3]